MTKKITNLYQTLELIEKRPLMYLSDTKISLLHSFITGYNISNNTHHRNENIFPPFIYFQRYVVKHYNINGYAVGWHVTLLLESNNDETLAFNRFFELLKDFKILKFINVYQTTVKDKHLVFHHSNECKTKKIINNDERPLYDEVDEVLIVEFSNSFGFALLMSFEKNLYRTHWSNVFETKEEAILEAEKLFGHLDSWTFQEEGFLGFYEKRLKNETKFNE